MKIRSHLTWLGVSSGSDLGDRFLVRADILRRGVFDIASINDTRLDWLSYSEANRVNGERGVRWTMR